MKTADKSIVKKLGKVHLYTGGGKGKTTSLLGLALRASGYGLRTFIGQFIKGRRCGEHTAIEGLLKDYIEIERFGDEHFLFMGGTPGEKDFEKAQYGLKRVEEKLHSGQFQIVMLDEICVAIAFGVVMVYQVENLIRSKPEKVEIILSGRWAHPRLIELADLVTEMRPIKHYMDDGVGARNGIEQ